MSVMLSPRPKMESWNGNFWLLRAARLPSCTKQYSTVIDWLYLAAVLDGNSASLGNKGVRGLGGAHSRTVRRMLVW